METLSDYELDQIEKRCNEALGGPWMVGLTDRSQILIKRHVETAIVASEYRLPKEIRERLSEFPNLTDEYGYVKAGTESGVESNMVKTLEFVAHAPEDVPKLVCEVRRLKKEIAELREKP